MSDTFGLIDEVSDGPLTAPFDANRTVYNVRLLDQYAKRTGKSPSEMSEEEVAQFIVRREDRKIA